MTFVKMRRPQFLKTLSQSGLSTQFMAVGIVLSTLYIFAALFSPFFQSIGWLQDPTVFLTNTFNEPPSFNNELPNLNHWFGTDTQGYDVFSRTLFGSQVALQVVVVATLFSLLIGVPLGLISGYLGGRLDRILLFLMDTIYTLPGLLLSVTVAFVLGRGVLNAAIALSVAYVPQYYRVVRNHTVSVKTELFVEAAQATGASPWRVLTRYLLLNVIQSVPVLFTLNAADAILTLAGLGFLGLGLPEEVPEWGHDLQRALGGLSTGIWWTTLFPGLAMTFLVVGLSLVGEGLNDLINPLLRRNSWRQ
jgi:peptide/nickel transport system permease protein